MANTQVIEKHTGIGDLLLKIVKVTGDGSATTMTAGSIGLSYITAVWTQDVDDDNALQISTYSGTTITFEAITATKVQLFFVLGY